MERKAFSKDLFIRAFRDKCIFIIVLLLAILFTIAVGTNLFCTTGLILMFICVIFAISTSYKELSGDEIGAEKSRALAWTFSIFGAISFIMFITFSARQYF